MIKFEDVVDAVKNLKDTEILSADLDNHSVYFKKNETSYFLTKPKRETTDPSVDFAIKMALQPKELHDGKLSHIEILELINMQNSNPANLCHIYYDKDINIIFAESKHVLFAANTSIHDDAINKRLDGYLTITLLGMLIIILESVGNISKAISELSKEKRGETKNEKN